MIPKKWSTASKDHIEDVVPAQSGVYELKCFGEIVYIGGSSNLQRRLLEHLNDRDPNKYRYETVTGFFSSWADREKELFNEYEDEYTGTPPWNDEDPR